jgi:hypothetical protein
MSDLVHGPRRWDLAPASQPLEPPEPENLLLLVGCGLLPLCQRGTPFLMDDYEGLLAPHHRGAVEMGGDRVERDLGPVLGVHKFLPAPIKQALVVFRNVTLGDEPRIIRVRCRAAEPHR